MKIYLCGSHSCGKTTLAKEISQRYGFTLVPEVSREILEEQQIDFKTFSSNALSADEFQNDVARLHCSRHTIYIDSTKDIVFDRGLDFIAYACMFSTKCGRQYKLYESYIDTLKEPNVRVFVIDPHESLMEKDGVRASMDMITAWSLTNNIKLLLEINNIPYISITAPNLIQRIKTIDAIIKWENA